MGYSLYICKNCCLPENSANLTYSEENDEHYHTNACNKSEKYKDKTYDEIHDILCSLKIYGRYISSKTLLLPSDNNILISYLQRFNRIKKNEKIHSLIIWEKFWNDIDVLIKKYKNQNTKSFKLALAFVNDNLYGSSE